MANNEPKVLVEAPKKTPDTFDNGGQETPVKVVTEPKKEPSFEEKVKQLIQEELEKQEKPEKPIFEFKKVDVTPISEYGTVSFRNLPKIEPTRDFYLHDKEKGKWIWIHHKHSSSSGAATSDVSAVSLSIDYYGGDLTVMSYEIGDIANNNINFTVFLNDYSNSFELIYIPNFTHIKAEY